MSDEEREDARLRALFEDLRRADEERAPGFERTAARARARGRRGSSVWLWVGAGGGAVAMAAVVLLAVNVAVLSRGGEDPAVAAPQRASAVGGMVLRGVEEPEPLAFLLERPGGGR